MSSREHGKEREKNDDMDRSGDHSSKETQEEAQRKQKIDPYESLAEALEY